LEGLVSEAKVFSDSLNSELIKNVEYALRGIKFVKDKILILNYSCNINDYSDYLAVS